MYGCRNIDNMYFSKKDTTEEQIINLCMQFQEKFQKRYVNVWIMKYGEETELPENHTPVIVIAYRILPTEYQFFVNYYKWFDTIVN